MKPNVYIAAAATVFAALLHLLPAIAGPGHDHGEGEPAAVNGKASPRFEAHSDLFEVVGVLGKSELALTVDRYQSNQPVLDAKVELESGAAKLLGQFHIDHGDYSFAPKSFEKPGAYPITLTITSGKDIDILAGNLLVPDAVAGAGKNNGVGGWLRWAVIGAVLAAIVAIVALMNRRRSRSNRHV